MMKKILTISGKGGTGKTVLSGAFAALAQKSILVDCDVDAANLHLLLQPQIERQELFRCGATAHIDPDTCAQCGLCRTLCRFEAIGQDYVVDPLSCEGCGFCRWACPLQAIEMEEKISGEWFVSYTRFGPFVHAKLGVAQENSGKLVSLIKQKAKEIGEQEGCEWMIIDGSPGIGCPVIASLSGVDCAVVVIEPTLSGLHDADRVIKVAQHFKIPVKMVINKCDLSPDIVETIMSYAKEKGIDVIGQIPFDKRIVDATVQGKTVVEDCGNDLTSLFLDIWNSI